MVFLEPRENLPRAASQLKEDLHAKTEVARVDTRAAAPDHRIPNRIDLVVPSGRAHDDGNPAAYGVRHVQRNDVRRREIHDDVRPGDPIAREARLQRILVDIHPVDDLVSRLLCGRLDGPSHLSVADQRDVHVHPGLSRKSKDAGAAASPYLTGSNNSGSGCRKKLIVEQPDGPLPLSLPQPEMSC